ncbi:MAG: response regulator [Phycisphaeraceae bacterium]|nr:response regulator [Phycisphaeraceae bacterium]
MISIRRVSGQYMLAAAALSMLPLLVLSVIVSWHVRDTLLDNARRETATGLEDLDRFIIQKIDGYKIDAKTIAAYTPIAGTYRAKANGGVDPLDGSTTEQWRARLTTLFIEYAREHPGVQQVRYLDEHGVEWLRVDKYKGETRVVPAAALQDKSDRAYFLRSAALGGDQCYVSPISLNVDHSRVQINNPVLRVSTPIWHSEKFQGVIVLNVSAETILDEIKQHFDQGRIIFAAESGEYMSHPDADKRWGEQLGTGHSLFKDWPGLTLNTIRSHTYGDGIPPLSLASGDGETEMTLSYISFDDHNEGWTVGLERDRAEVLAASTAMNRYILITTAIVGLIVTLLAMLGSLIWTKPIKQLSAAAEAIREGDYSVRLKAARKDELGDMARSFNRMAMDLEKALEIDRKRAEAEASNAAKSAFLANMSHEIRTPMNAILGFTDLLLADGITEADCKDYIQTIQRNGDHLMCVINDILDLSKVESGKMSVESVQTSLPDLVGRVSSLMRSKAQQKGVQIKQVTGEDMPEYVFTDPVRLRQILINLMGNAIKFTHEGSVILRANHKRIDDQRAELIFEVRDTGIGIPPEKIEKLFKPFNQADESITRHYGGTGLGLTLSKQFVDLLGGEIQVESIPGQGSTFRVIVPVKLAQTRSTTTKTSEATGTNQDQTPATDRFPGVRVLLAEDGKDNQRLIMFHLKKLGVEVELCENGKDAYERALEQRDAGAPFDLILMDMQMPVMDGYTATSRLREEGYAGPVIALTAHAMSGDRQRCIAAGCDDYETKPINSERLAQLIRARLQPKRAA